MAADPVSTRSLVTVCVPTIGRTEYLETSLRSLSDQTYPEYEVLVLDNASAPEAQAIIQQFVSTRSNARTLRVDERLPMFENFNRGIVEARGDYVVFFHDDDQYQPEFLERHVAVLEAYPRAGFVGSNFDVIDGDGRISARHRAIERRESWAGCYFIERLYRRGRADFPTPGLVFRRAAITDVGWDARLPMNWGDFTVLMRIAEKWDVAVLPGVTYAWRNHGQNSSTLRFSHTLRIRTQVMNNYCEEYAAKYPHQTAFVDRLKRHMAADLRRSLMWGWLSAPDAAEAAACREFLAEWHPRTACVLRALEMLGVTVERRRAAAPAARSLTRRWNS